MTVSVNDFVRRQVSNSGKTYAKTLSFEQVANHAKDQMKRSMFKEGYRDGVRLVMVAESLVSDFVCPYVELNETTRLISTIVRRQPEEEPYVQTRA